MASQASKQTPQSHPTSFATPDAAQSYLSSLFLNPTLASILLNNLPTYTLEAALQTITLPKLASFHLQIPPYADIPFVIALFLLVAPPQHIICVLTFIQDTIKQFAHYVSPLEHFPQSSGLIDPFESELEDCLCSFHSPSNAAARLRDSSERVEEAQSFLQLVTTITITPPSVEQVFRPTQFGAKYPFLDTIVKLSFLNYPNSPFIWTLAWGIRWNLFRAKCLIFSTTIMPQREDSTSALSDLAELALLYNNYDTSGPSSQHRRPQSQPPRSRAKKVFPLRPHFFSSTFPMPRITDIIPLNALQHLTFKYRIYSSNTRLYGPGIESLEFTSPFLSRHARKALQHSHHPNNPPLHRSLQPHNRPSDQISSKPQHQLSPSAQTEHDRKSKAIALHSIPINLAELLHMNPDKHLPRLASHLYNPSMYLPENDPDYAIYSTSIDSMLVSPFFSRMQFKPPHLVTFRHFDTEQLTDEPKPDSTLSKLQPPRAFSMPHPNLQNSQYPQLTFISKQNKVIDSMNQIQLHLDMVEKKRANGQVQTSPTDSLSSSFQFQSTDSKLPILECNFRQSKLEEAMNSTDSLCSPFPTTPLHALSLSQLTAKSTPYAVLNWAKQNGFLSQNWFANILLPTTLSIAPNQQSLNQSVRFPSQITSIFPAHNFHHFSCTMPSLFLTSHYALQHFNVALHSVTNTGLLPLNPIFNLVISWVLKLYGNQPVHVGFFSTKLLPNLQAASPIVHDAIIGLIGYIMLIEQAFREEDEGTLKQLHNQQSQSSIQQPTPPLPYTRFTIAQMVKVMSIYLTRFDTNDDYFIIVASLFLLIQQIPQHDPFVVPYFESYLPHVEEYKYREGFNPDPKEALQLTTQTPTTHTFFPRSNHDQLDQSDRAVPESDHPASKEDKHYLSFDFHTTQFHIASMNTSHLTQCPQLVDIFHTILHWCSDYISAPFHFTPAYLQYLIDYDDLLQLTDTDTVKQANIQQPNSTPDHNLNPPQGSEQSSQPTTPLNNTSTETPLDATSSLKTQLTRFTRLETFHALTTLFATRNQFSIMYYVLVIHNFDITNIDIFTALLQHTHQFELTSYPIYDYSDEILAEMNSLLFIGLSLPRSLQLLPQNASSNQNTPQNSTASNNHCPAENTYDPRATTILKAYSHLSPPHRALSTLLASKVSTTYKVDKLLCIEPTFIVSHLIKKNYPITITQLFLNLADFDWTSTVDGYGLTVLDYCIMYQYHHAGNVNSHINKLGKQFQSQSDLILATSATHSDFIAEVFQRSEGDRALLHPHHFTPVNASKPPNTSIPTTNPTMRSISDEIKTRLSRTMKALPKAIQAMTHSTTFFTDIYRHNRALTDLPNISINHPLVATYPHHCYDFEAGSTINATLNGNQYLDGEHRNEAILSAENSDSNLPHAIDIFSIPSHVTFSIIQEKQNPSSPGGCIHYPVINLQHVHYNGDFTATLTNQSPHHSQVDPLAASYLQPTFHITLLPSTLSAQTVNNITKLLESNTPVNIPATHLVPSHLQPTSPPPKSSSKQTSSTEKTAHENIDSDPLVNLATPPTYTMLPEQIFSRTELAHFFDEINLQTKPIVFRTLLHRYFAFLPADCEIQRTTIEQILKTMATPSEPNPMAAQSPQPISPTPTQPRSSAESEDDKLDLISTDLITWPYLLQLLSLPNLIQLYSNQQFLCTFAFKFLQKYLTPSNPFEEAKWDIAHDTPTTILSIYDFVNQNTNKYLKLSQFDAIYLLYKLIDHNFAPNLVSQVIDSISPSYYQYLFYFYLLPQNNARFNSTYHQPVTISVNGNQTNNIINTQPLYPFSVRGVTTYHPHQVAIHTRFSTPISPPQQVQPLSFSTAPSLLITQLTHKYSPSIPLSYLSLHSTEILSEMHLLPVIYPHINHRKMLFSPQYCTNPDFTVHPTQPVQYQQSHYGYGFVPELSLRLCTPWQCPISSQSTTSFSTPSHAPSSNTNNNIITINAPHIPLHPVFHNVSPTLLDLVLTKPNYIPYLYLLLTRCDLLKHIPMHRLSSSIYTIGTTYYLQFLHIFTTDFSQSKGQFTSLTLLSTPTPSSIKLTSSVDARYTLETKQDGKMTNFTTFTSINQLIIPHLSPSPPPSTSLTHASRHRQLCSAPSLCSAPFQHDTINTIDIFNMSLPAVFIFLHYHHPLTSQTASTSPFLAAFFQALQNGASPNHLVPFPQSPVAAWMMKHCNAVTNHPIFNPHSQRPIYLRKYCYPLTDIKRAQTHIDFAYRSFFGPQGLERLLLRAGAVGSDDKSPQQSSKVKKASKQKVDQKECKSHKPHKDRAISHAGQTQDDHKNPSQYNQESKHSLTFQQNALKYQSKFETMDRFLEKQKSSDFTYPCPPTDQKLAELYTRIKGPLVHLDYVTMGLKRGPFEFTLADNNIGVGVNINIDVSIPSSTSKSLDNQHSSELTHDHISTIDYTTEYHPAEVPRPHFNILFYILFEIVWQSAYINCTNPDYEYSHLNDKVKGRGNGTIQQRVHQRQLYTNLPSNYCTALPPSQLIQYEIATQSSQMDILQEEYSFDFPSQTPSINHQVLSLQTTPVLKSYSHIAQELSEMRILYPDVFTRFKYLSDESITTQINKYMDDLPAHKLYPREWVTTWSNALGFSNPCPDGREYLYNAHITLDNAQLSSTVVPYKSQCQDILYPFLLQFYTHPSSPFHFPAPQSAHSTRRFKYAQHSQPINTKRTKTPFSPSPYTFHNIYHIDINQTFPLTWNFLQGANFEHTHYEPMLICPPHGVYLHKMSLIDFSHLHLWHLIFSHPCPPVDLITFLYRFNRVDFLEVDPGHFAKYRPKLTATSQQHSMLPNALYTSSGIKNNHTSSETTTHTTSSTPDVSTHVFGSPLQLILKVDELPHPSSSNTTTSTTSRHNNSNMNTNTNMNTDGNEKNRNRGVTATSAPIPQLHYNFLTFLALRRAPAKLIQHVADLFYEFYTPLHCPSSGNPPNSTNPTNQQQQQRLLQEQDLIIQSNSHFLSQYYKSQSYQSSFNSNSNSDPNPNPNPDGTKPIETKFKNHNLCLSLYNLPFDWLLINYRLQPPNPNLPVPKFVRRFVWPLHFKIRIPTIDDFLCTIGLFVKNVPGSEPALYPITASNTFSAALLSMIEASEMNGNVNLIAGKEDNNANANARNHNQRKQVNTRSSKQYGQSPKLFNDLEDANALMNDARFAHRHSHHHNAQLLFNSNQQNQKQHPSQSQKSSTTTTLASPSHKPIKTKVNASHSSMTSKKQRGGGGGGHHRFIETDPLDLPLYVNNKSPNDDGDDDDYSSDNYDESCYNDEEYEKHDLYDQDDEEDWELYYDIFDEDDDEHCDTHE